MVPFAQASEEYAGNLKQRRGYGKVVIAVVPETAAELME